MGCCCSSCRVPDIEISRDVCQVKQRHHERSKPQSPQALQQPSQSTPQQSAPVTRAPETFEPSPILPGDEPPPYDSNAVQVDTVHRGVVDHRETLEPAASQASRQEAKELPYVIPLTSAGTGTSSEDSLAAAYAPDMQALGVPSHAYIAFLAGLDQGLFASPTAQPGSVSAYIHSMFQDQGSSSQDLSWQSSTSADSISRSKAYVAEKNAEIFHKAWLHVEVLGTEDMKRRIDDVSEASLLKAESDKKLNKIESTRSEQTLKLEQRLLTSKTLEKQQKAMQKFLEKNDKYDLKALKVISKTEKALDNEDVQAGKTRAEQENNDGVYWLLVTRYEV